MNDRELRRQFLRIERGGGRVRLLVCEIHWDGPGNSVSAWVVGQHLPETATDAEVNTAASKILEDDQYFRVCVECNERNPLGWMDDEQICQSCAVANHGIVYGNLRLQLQRLESTEYFRATLPPCKRLSLPSK